MTPAPDILCIGSVLWDTIGRSTAQMRQGSDMPGRITRLPGGVALNIAMALKAYGMTPALCSVVGQDAAGEALVAACMRMGLITDLLYRADDLPTDQYMAVEGSNGMIAAIADAHSLEAAGDRILRPLHDGRLPIPWNGPIALDGNLTEPLLARIASDPAFRDRDLRVAPASPGKAGRLAPFLGHSGSTLYVNLEEAGLILNRECADTPEAAKSLVESGLKRALVTDGARPASVATAEGCETQAPPKVQVTRVTGAGDTFMAAHIAAEAQGHPRALHRALEATATYISSETY